MALATIETTIYIYIYIYIAHGLLNDSILSEPAGKRRTTPNNNGAQETHTATASTCTHHGERHALFYYVYLCASERFCLVGPRRRTCVRARMLLCQASIAQLVRAAVDLKVGSSSLPGSVSYNGGATTWQVGSAWRPGLRAA